MSLHELKTRTSNTIVSEMQRPSSYHTMPKPPPARHFTSEPTKEPLSGLRRTHSDVQVDKKRSLASKQRRKISKNARKLVGNFVRLGRENSVPSMKRQEKCIKLSGQLYKKRQGFTGFQAKLKARVSKEELINKLWPLRYVELKNGVLSYYKIKVIGEEKVVSTRSRGSIDLKQKGVCLKLSYPHSDSEDLPTDLQFDIVYNNILKPTEWITYTFCCQDRDQFYTWVMALSHEMFNRNYLLQEPLGTRDAKANSVTSDTFSVGTEILKPRASSSIPVIDLNPLIGDDLTVREPSTSMAVSLPTPTQEEDADSVIPTETEQESDLDMDASSVNSSSTFTGKVRKRFFSRKRRTVDFNENLRKLDILDRQSSSDSMKQSDGEGKADKKAETSMSAQTATIVFREVVFHIGVFQLLTLFLIFKQLSLDVAVVCVIVFNTVLMRSLYSLFDIDAPILEVLGFETPKLQEKLEDTEIQGSQNSIALPSPPPSYAQKKIEVKGRPSRDSTVLTSKGPSLNPFAFDFSEDMEHLDPKSSSGTPQTWSYADHRLLKFRKGPDYKSNKEKAATATSFFVPVAMDVYGSPNGKKINNVMKHIKFPHALVNPSCRSIPKDWKGVVPDLLVVNFQIPGGSFFKSKAGDQTQSWLQFFSPADFFIHSLADDLKQDNATRLFLKWLKYAEVDQEVKHKLKLLAYVRNLKESGLPGWLSRFNGKPCMITKSCVMHRGTSFDTITGRDMHYLELDIDVGAWGLMVKRGVKTIVPGILRNLHWSVSLVIQGESNDELPERAINAMEFYKCDTSLYGKWPFPNE